MAFTTYSKKNPCPICSGTNGCKTDLVYQTIVCLRSQEPIVNGYSFVKSASQNSAWSVYKPTELVKNSKEFTQEEKARYFAEKQARREKEAIAEAARQDKLLTSKEIDARLSHLFNDTIDLNREDRLDLLERGISNQQIEDGGFYPVTRGSYYLSASGFAGFPEGKYIGSSGYLCFARDAEGLVVGCQVKTNEEGQAKYKWTSHSENGVQVQAKVKEYNEYPMNVARYGIDIFISEGMLKSYVAARRLNATVIGYAGGQFSPKYLQVQLNKLALPGTKVIVIALDAGGLVNDNVFNLNLRYAEAIESWGYEVKVADWGQWVSKVKGDIDEIESHAEIKYQSIEYYKACKADTSIYTGISVAEELVTKYGVNNFFKAAIAKIKNLVAVSPRKIQFSNTESDWTPYIQNNLPQFHYFSKPYEYTCEAQVIYQEAFRKGYKYILDISATGAGKTHCAAKIEPLACFLHTDEQEVANYKSWHLTTQSRNPNVIRLETDYKELPARNLGYSLDYEKLTPSGKPWRGRLDDEMPRTDANCHWTHKFHQAREKRTEVDICGSCPFRSKCAVSEDDGYGYIYQTKMAMKSTKIIANPNGLSSSMPNEKAIAVVDEYNQSVNWLESVSIHSGDVKHLQSFIAQSNATKLYELLPFLNKVGKLVSKEERSVDKRYGITSKAILEELGELDYSILKESVELLVKTIDSTNDSFVSDTSLAEEALSEKLSKNWLDLLIKVVSNENYFSSLSLHNNVLTITNRNDRMLEVFEAFKGVVFQDATGSREDLGYKLGMIEEHERSKILVIRKKSLVPHNLTIHHVKGLGIGGNQRRDSASARFAAAENAIASRHSSVGFIRFKKFSKTGDLVHCSTGRGSNQFEKMEAVVTSGIPIPNIGSLKAAYECFKGQIVEGSLDEFQLFVNNAVMSELIQELGRLRANRRLEKLHYYVLGDVDLTFFSELGYKVEEIEAITLDINCADKQQKAKYVITEAFRKLSEAGQNITQSAIAKEANCTPSNVSHLSKAVGGWERLKEIMMELIKAPIDSGNTKPSRNIVKCANEWLPELFNKDIEEYAEELNTIREKSKEKFLQIFSHVPVESVITFLVTVLKSLPAHQRQEFLDLNVVC